MINYFHNIPIHSSEEEGESALNRVLKSSRFVPTTRSKKGKSPFHAMIIQFLKGRDGSRERSIVIHSCAIVECHLVTLVTQRGSGKRTAGLINEDSPPPLLFPLVAREIPRSGGDNAGTGRPCRRLCPFFPPPSAIARRYLDFDRDSATGHRYLNRAKRESVDNIACVRSPAAFRKDWNPDLLTHHPSPRYKINNVTRSTLRK